MSEPRSIEPQDIRPGDRICVAWSVDRIDRTHTLRVAEVDLESMLVRASVVSSAWVTLAPNGDATITLLDRPTPERPVGSHWRDPETGAEYVRTDGVGGSLYYRVRFAQGMPRKLNPEYYNLIARLQPLPAFDPATLWPPAKLDDDWCAVPDENTGNVCSRPAGHDGWVHAAYEAYVGRQELGPLLAIWGDPR